MRCRVWLLPVTLLHWQGILASEVDMDPLSNLRPDNITGLAYDLYRWTGSYYNGTTTIRLQPQDFVQNSTCENIVTGPIIVSYNTSLLAVTPTNGHLIHKNYEAANPLAFSLKFWPVGLLLGGMQDGHVNQIQEISSVRMNKKDEPDDPKAIPPWNLAASHDAALSYSFTGTRNQTFSSQPLLFNYTQCTSRSLVLYNGTLLDHATGSPNISVTADPRVNGAFSDARAMLEIKGVYQWKSTGGTFLRGNMIISFNGTTDEARSDRLLPNTHSSTPVWESTLGYEKTLMGEMPKVQIGNARALRVEWIWLAGMITFVVMCSMQESQNSLRPLA